jgi:hypothetical protein
MMLVLIGTTIVVIVVSVGFAWVIRKAKFEERFPPISDAEFLARCSPGVNPAVALKVRQMAADYFAIEYERVHPSTCFIKDLGAD